MAPILINIKGTNTNLPFDNEEAAKAFFAQKDWQDKIAPGPDSKGTLGKLLDFIKTPVVSAKTLNEGNHPEEYTPGSDLADLHVKPGEKENLPNIDRPNLLSSKEPIAGPLSSEQSTMKGVGTGLSKAGSSLTSPLNMMLMALGIKMPVAGLAAGATMVPGMVSQGISDLKEGKVAREGNQPEQAGEKYTTAIANLLAAAGITKGVTTAGKEIISPSDPFNKAINPDVKAIAQSGFPLTASEIVQSRPQQWIQRLLERNPVLAQKFKNFGDKQRGALTADVNNFSDQVGKANPEDVAAATNEGITQYERGFKDTSGQLYDKASKLAGSAKEPMGFFTKMIQDILTKQKDLPEGLEAPGVVRPLTKTLNDLTSSPELSKETSATRLGDVDELSQFLKDHPNVAISKSGSGIGPEELSSGKTFDQMREIRTALKDSLKSTDIIGSRKEGVYKQLLSSVEADLNSFAEKHGGDILDSYQKANEYYGPGKRTLNSDLTKKLSKLADENPTAIASAAIQPGNPARIQMAKELLGRDFEPIKQQFTQNLIDQSSVLPQGATERVIQGGKLMENLNKYGPEVLQEVFSPAELKQITELGQKANLSRSAVKASGEGTLAGGRGAQPIRTLLRALVGTPFMPVVDAMLSDTGRKIMSTKLPDFKTIFGSENKNASSANSPSIDQMISPNQQPVEFLPERNFPLLNAPREAIEMPAPKQKASAEPAVIPMGPRAIRLPPKGGSLEGLVKLLTEMAGPSRELLPKERMPSNVTQPAQSSLSKPPWQEPNLSIEELVKILASRYGRNYKK